MDSLVHRGAIITKLRFSCSSLKNPILRDTCWVKGKIALLRKSAILVEDGLISQRTNSPLPIRGQEFLRGGAQAGEGWTTCRTAQSAPTIILKLVVLGLISVILILLSTVNLQFQGWFVPISLRSVLIIV